MIAVHTFYNLLQMCLVASGLQFGDHVSWWLDAAKLRTVRLVKVTAVVCLWSSTHSNCSEPLQDSSKASETCLAVG